MLDEILQPESKTFKHGGKEYTINPMDIVLTTKVLKIIPVMGLFTNPTQAIFGLLGSDADKVVEATIVASGMPKEIIGKMMPHQIVELLKVIFEVNKQSFLLAKNSIMEAIESMDVQKKELDGKGLSKHSSATAIDSKT